MMRILRRISAFICMLLVFSLGIIFISTSVVYIMGMNGQAYIESSLQDYIQKMRDTSTTKVSTLLIGLGLLLVSFLTIYLAIVDIHSSARIKIESPDGKLTVSVSAIENYISRMGRTIDGVKELRAKLRRTPNGWALYGRVTVFSDRNINETNEKIHEEIREGIYKIMGSHSIEPIDIHVSKIDDRGGRVGSRRSIDVEFTSEKGMFS
jgi:uncharacterized alkaline shock family protein YloU